MPPDLRLTTYRNLVSWDVGVIIFGAAIDEMGVDVVAIRPL
jgi:hypothetical protein